MLRMFWLMFKTFFAVARRRWRHGPLRPTWSFLFEVVVTTMRRDSDERESWPVPRIRKHISRLPVPRGALRRVRKHEIDIAGCSCLWMSADKSAAPESLPESSITGDVLLFFHGGSYQYGSVKNSHADIMARLTLATGTPAFGLDYRLAPEHPYPAALDDAIATYDWLLERGVPPARIILSGDSAGGNLALALMIHLRENGREQPGAAMLISPWVDLACRRPSMTRNADYDFGTRSMLLGQGQLYAGELSPEDARLSVIDADLSELPPLYIQVGGAELLEDECHELAERARAAGVDVTVDVLVDMPHDGPLFAAYAPEAARSIGRAAEFMTGIWQTAARQAGADAQEPATAE